MKEVKNMLSFRLLDDSMEQKSGFLKGDFIIVDTSLKPVPGDYVVAARKDDPERKFFRQLRKVGRVRYIAALNDLFEDIKVDKNWILWKAIRRQRDYDV